MLHTLVQHGGLAKYRIPRNKNVHTITNDTILYLQISLSTRLISQVALGKFMIHAIKL